MTQCLCARSTKQHYWPQTFERNLYSMIGSRSGSIGWLCELFAVIIKLNWGLFPTKLASEDFEYFAWVVWAILFCFCVIFEAWKPLSLFIVTACERVIVTVFRVSFCVPQKTVYGFWMAWRWIHNDWIDFKRYSSGSDPGKDVNAKLFTNMWLRSRNQQTQTWPFLYLVSYSLIISLTSI